MIVLCRQQEYARSKREEREEDALKKIQEQAEKARAASGLHSHSATGEMGDISQVIIDMGMFSPNNAQLLFKRSNVR